MPTPRQSSHEYHDPLDTVWMHAAEAMGLAVVFTTRAYADSDGRGTIALGTTRILDPDDCVAQMVFHEICHWLVEGKESLHKINWGLDNTSLRDLDREYATLRLQAALSHPFGLRKFLANTTDHRSFYDALPANPLANSEDDSTELARQGLARASEKPWGPTLQEALSATQRIVAATALSARPPSLYCLYEPE